MTQYLIIGNTNTKILSDNKLQVFSTKDFLKKKNSFDRQDTYIATVIASLNFTNAYLVSFTDLQIPHSVLAIDKVGIDRLLNCYAMFDQFTDFMVVDFGTAISISVVRAGIFRGGFILPGVKMSCQALSQGTDGLKNISFVDPQEFTIGANTDQAVSFGIFWAISAAVKEFYRKTFQDDRTIPLIITGGHAKIFAKQCQDFSQKFLFDENLQLKGLQKFVTKRQN